MKTAALFKILPMAAVAVLVLSRTGSSGRKGKSLEPEAVPQALHGVVRKVLQDRHFTYVLLNDQGAQFWIATESAPPQIDDRVGCEVTKVRDAYESRELTMAFERVYFVGELKFSEIG